MNRRLKKNLAPTVFLLLLLLSALGVWLWLRSLERDLLAPYHLVENGLYVGEFVREPPPGTQAVVNLCGGEDPYVVEAHFWEPILEGGKEPGVKWLKCVVEFINTHHGAGKTTYIHCMAGVNRSGMAVTAYLMYKHNWSLDRALKFVQSKRPKIKPNSKLMRLLAEYEKELNKKPVQ